MPKFTIQRPATIWIETVVEADNLDEALHLADDDFSNGEYIEIDGTWNVDFDKYWTQDEKGETTYA